MKAKRKEEAAPKQQEVATAKAQIKDLESVIERSEGQLSEILLTVPNIPHESVAACTHRGIPPPGSCWASFTSDCTRSLATSGAVIASSGTSDR